MTYRQADSQLGQKAGWSTTAQCTRIDVALLVLISTTALNLSFVFSERYGTTGLAKICVAFLVGTILIGAMHGTVTEIRLDRLGVVSLLTYCIGATLTVFWAYAPTEAVAWLDSLLRDGIVALLVIFVIASFDLLRRAVRTLYLSLAVLASLSVFQMLTGTYSFDFGGLAGGGMHNVAGEVEGWRLYGPFTDANSFGRVLLIGIPLAAQEVLCSSPRWKTIGAISLLLLLIALTGTYSRGALLGLAAIAIPIVISYGRHWRLQFLILVPLCLLANNTEYAERFADAWAAVNAEQPGRVTDLSTIYRLDEMRLAGIMFSENLWGGLGPRGYQERFQQYANERHLNPRGEDRQAHSLPLEIAAEGGLVMLTAFVFLCAVQARTVLVVLRQPISREDRRLASGIALSMLGYLSASLLLHADFSRLFWLLCGLLVTLPICANTALRRPLDEAVIPLNRMSSCL